VLPEIKKRHREQDKKRDCDSAPENYCPKPLKPSRFSWPAIIPHVVRQRIN
jgi:hypothetical protein